MKTRTIALIGVGLVGLALLSRSASAAQRARADSDAYGLPNQPGYRTSAAPMSYLDSDALSRAIASQIAAQKAQTAGQTTQTAQAAQPNSGAVNANNMAAIASLVSTFANLFD